MKTMDFGPEICVWRIQIELQFDILYTLIQLTVQKLWLFEIDYSIRLFGPLLLLFNSLYILFCNLFRIIFTITYKILGFIQFFFWFTYKLVNYYINYNNYNM